MSLNINVADYRRIITWISKSEVVNLLQKADLNEKRRTLQSTKKLFSNIKMDKQILTFGDTEIEKNKFYLNSYFLGNVDIKNIIVFNNISFGEKS